MLALGAIEQKVFLQSQDRLRDRRIVVQIYVFVFDAAPQALNKDVVQRRSEWESSSRWCSSQLKRARNRRFFLLGVYGSLSERPDLRKLLKDLVAGAGFEPATFGL